MDLGLRHKRALVTGASRGLAYATARQLALEGCAVAINSRDAEKLAEAASRLHQETGMQVIALPGDLLDPSVPDQLVQDTAQAFGGLDILITNTGGPPPGKFESFDDAAWQKAVELSFLCHVRLIRAALPYLRQSEAPSVLTVTSITVKQPIANLVLSNSVRAATLGLTKSLALELGQLGIRFNSILPSWTETERIQELLANRARNNNTTLDQEYARQASEAALGRLGHPDEFGRVAAFIVSPAASYLTGSNISPDGGAYKGLI